MTDVHTHTTFSTDGIDDIAVMYARAVEMGIAYWGISEHFDYDYLVNHIRFKGEPIDYTDPDKYFPAAKKLQAESKDVRILVGGELGYAHDRMAHAIYMNLIEQYQPDFIVNSVHTNGKYDFYEEEAFAGKDKKTAYGEYLALVRESLDAYYNYDIVGHIGYCCRFAPYEDRKMRYEEFAPQLDDILKTIIAKGKILEANSSVKGMDTSFLPFEEIFKRYFELGGREVSFASDAHGANRL
ncbi:MAG: histidinol-phosphatase HisJ family protein [Clostridia bacterium]|nr:histidinol-phosphatase HisJ family protein [Clostridia bacterium]